MVDFQTFRQAGLSSPSLTLPLSNLFISFQMMDDKTDQTLSHTKTASKCLETNQPKDEDHPSALKKARITSAEGKYGADEEKKVVTEDG